MCNDVLITPLTLVGGLLTDSGHCKSAEPVANIQLLSTLSFPLCEHHVSPRQTCVDEPSDWTDVDGYGCVSYVGAQWCSAEGTTGAGWSSAWGTIEDYARNGISGLDACCGCGGGGILTTLAPTSSAPTVPPPPCYDVPEWRDPDQYTCDDWQAANW